MKQRSMNETAVTERPTTKLSEGLARWRDQTKYPTSTKPTPKRQKDTKLSLVTPE